jgi:hypothetical protein
VSVLLVGCLRNCSIISNGGPRDFSLFQVSRPALGPTQLPVEWVVGPVTLGMKWLGCIANHSPPFSAKFKNGGVICLMSIHLYGVHMGVLTFVSEKGAKC